MLQYNPTVSGSLNITGSLQVSGDITGTVNGINITGLSQSVSSQLVNVQSSTGSSDAKFQTLSGVTSSALTRLTNIETKSASVDISISNINSVTASNIARLSNLETKSSSVDISLSSINTFTSSNANTSLNTYTGSNDTKFTTLATYTGSLDTKNTILSSVTSSLISKTGSYATTGSNQFYGTQVFSGSVYIANDLVVQGSSSIQYISASSVSIGTNIVQLNTANPSVRFAGLTIIDSGSVGGSGSFLYDSLQDEFIFVHRGNGTNVTSSHFVLGPETYDNLGNETYLTCNLLTKGTGKEHLVDSCIFDNGTTTCIKNNLVGTGTISGTTIYGSTIACSPIGCFATSCATAFIGGTMSGTTIYGSTAVCSPVGKFSTCIDAGSGTFSGGVTATSFNLGNGQYLRLTRNSGTLQYDAFGIVVGTDNTRIISTNDFDIVNGGLVSQFKIAGSGAATFACSVSIGGADQGYQLDVKRTSTGDSTFDTVANFYKASTHNTGLLLRLKNTIVDLTANNITGGGGPTAGMSFSVSSGGTISTALTIASTGIACFACQVCAKSLYFSSNATGQITFGSNDACNPYIVSDSSNNLYFGSNNGYKILVPQDGSDMVFRTSPTYANPQTRLTITAAGIATFACQVCAPTFKGGTIYGTAGYFSCHIELNDNGSGWIYGVDKNHSIILRGDRTGCVADFTNYYQYGGNLSTGKGHNFWTDGVLASQTIKMQIANNGICMTVPLYVCNSTNSRSFQTIAGGNVIGPYGTCTLLYLSTALAGTYIINASFGPQGLDIYGGMLIVVANGGSFRVITNGSGTRSAITLSGCAVQLTNALGVTLEASAQALFIGGL